MSTVEVGARPVEHCCPTCGAGWHWGGYRRCPECGRYGHSVRAEDFRRTDAYRRRRGIREWKGTT